MIGWTIFNWFCLVPCSIFMFDCDKDYLSNLLKYNAATAIYIFSFVNAWFGTFNPVTSHQITSTEIFL